MLAVAADYILLRESSISLLADAVTAAGYASMTRGMLADAVDVCVGVLTMESERSSKHIQATRNMRRSAAFMLRHIVTHLGEKLIGMRGGLQTLQTLVDIMTLYAQNTSTGVDEVVKFHCICGLNAYESVIERQFLEHQEAEERNIPAILKILKK
jgi:hypothetical protein